MSQAVQRDCLRPQFCSIKPSRRQNREVVVRCQASHSNEEAASSRRTALSLLAAAPAAALLGAGVPPLAAVAAEVELTSTSSAGVDTTVTDRLFLDIGLCPEAVRANRTLGDRSILCTDPEPMGRITIDLYGRAAPGSVATIMAAARAGAYNGSQLSKVLPGRFLVAGTQGPRRAGYVQAPDGLPPNPDILSSSAFRLPHLRPGTVSLNLSENEDDEDVRFGKNYRNLSLLITTGPGPVPSLDGENIVVGQVSEGLDVVAAITQVPIFAPNENARRFNQLGQLLGDERASKTAAKWGRPLKAVVIVAAGVL